MLLLLVLFFAGLFSMQNITHWLRISDWFLRPMVK